MTLTEFRKRLKPRHEFRHIVVSRPYRGSNLLAVTGDIVGEAAYAELRKLGRECGFILLADELSIWETEEFFAQYGTASKK